jgi:hypothetical protein
MNAAPCSWRVRTKRISGEDRQVHRARDAEDMVDAFPAKTIDKRLRGCSHGDRPAARPRKSLLAVMMVFLLDRAVYGEGQAMQPLFLRWVAAATAVSLG